mmetsp:Transcript_2581/g.2819  ORF Transcript_2581/g.2819 Transcript_2581/m.2819 type:complete len:181 (+) Transcript_2581:42-584(+)|eukprot:CAMPEP_0198255070 /NCGR_PEP_ID=MMETSP1447-20131203/5295_1 /TAXON_ID=420782 /ORGANISM="Chaetoceros dichaeta, Strain CCMP1751" /LENGTH=180 /DNA_ID=CAMNT_0043941367 /DNA_START=17 /DNA_END=559 /DNA_ORIENTATION=+
MRQTIHFKLFAMVAMCSILIAGASERVLKASNGEKSKKSKGSKAPPIGLWYEDDTVVTLVPKWKIKQGPRMREQFMALLPKFVERVQANDAETCVHYGFVGPTEDGYVICREGYTSAEGALSHILMVDDLSKEVLKYADMVEMQIQGPAEELEIMKQYLGEGTITYYPLSKESLRSKRMW